MKRVGIITIVKVNNYGAELQAYATQRILVLLGCDAELIDYVYYKSWNFKDTRMSRPLVPMTFKEHLKYWMKYRMANIVVETILPWINEYAKKRKKRFELFHKKNSRFSRRYGSMDELYQNTPEYDIYMTGSDQVWNPSAFSSIEPYFLTFAPKGKRKVSYAASLGVSEIPNTLKDKYSQWLGSYDAIAIREENGKNCIKQLLEMDVEWVIDPTLLLGKREWMKVSEVYPCIPPNYVLIYQLSDSITIENLALRIGKEKGIPVYRICKRAYCIRKTTSITNIPDAGPAEFISLIANANYLITNSFHGTAFAINLSVQFYTVLSATKKNNSRMESLLGLVELKKRLVRDDIVIEKIDITSQIDFTPVQILLQKEREKSKEYLKRIISSQISEPQYRI